MDKTSEPRSKPGCGHYDSNYGNFHTELYEEIRREAFGEDIGQNSWHTAEEQNKFIEWLGLSADKTLLDVACGAGGPALRIAAITNCSVVGVDFHEQAVSAARTLTAERRLEHLAKFQHADASTTLPFPDNSFDALMCIDAINHLARPSSCARRLGTLAQTRRPATVYRCHHRHRPADQCGNRRAQFRGFLPLRSAKI